LNFVGVGVSVAAATAIIVVVAMTAIGTSVLAQSDQGDVVLLSHRFNDDSMSSEIVGEVMNNGTGGLDKYDINIIASFYDSAGVLAGSEQGFIDAQTLAAGDRSAFNVFTTDDAIMNEAATYDISINDQRILEGASIDGDDGPVNSDSDESGDEDS
jgi:hypothetical protein